MAVIKTIAIFTETQQRSLAPENSFEETDAS